MIISIWIPDPDLNTNSVTGYETDKSGVPISSKGLLNDAGMNGDATAGDKVYTLQFAVNDATPTTHHYTVSYKSLSTGATYSTEVDTTASVPTVSVSDSASYAANIQDIITRIKGAGASYQALQPTPTTLINESALESFVSTEASVVGDIQQLSSFDSANPQIAHLQYTGSTSEGRPISNATGSFWSLLPFGLGDYMTKASQLESEKVAFTGSSFDPNDPVKYDFALFGLGIFEKF